MCLCSQRWLAALPALAFAVGAIVLAAGSFASAEPAPVAAPGGVTVAAPESLSPAVTTRDWQEVNGSGTKRKFK